MKKIISILAALLILFSIFAISVSAEENYCQLFEKQWFALTHIDEYGSKDKPWSANSITYITAMTIDYYNYADYNKAENFKTEHNIDYDVEYYSIPKNIFESLANKIFDVKVDLSTAFIKDHEDENSTIFPRLYYNSSTQTYDFICYPKGGGAVYAVYGYSKLGNTYTVYLQKEDYNQKLNEFGKAVATCDGNYAKLISFEVISNLPSKDTLITPSTVTSSKTDTSSSLSSTQTSSEASSESQTSSEPTSTTVPTITLADKYDVVLSATQGVFSETAVVTIAKKTDSEELSVIKNTIGKEYSKFVAFDFSATENGSPVQPNGKVNAIFELPVDYDIDNIAVLYVPDIGEIEAAPITVDKATRTVTAELSHFSTYVLAEIYTEQPTDDNGGADVLLIVFIVLIVILLLGGGAAWYFLVFRKKLKTSKTK